MNNILIISFLSMTSIGSSLKAMEEVVAKKRLNAEQFMVLKELIGEDGPKEFIGDTEARFPDSFSEGMPDDLFKDLDGEALQWIVEQEALIKEKNIDNLEHELDMFLLQKDKGKKMVGHIVDAAVYLGIQPILDAIKPLFENSSRTTKGLLELAIKYKDITFADYSQLFIDVAGGSLLWKDKKEEIIKLFLNPRLKVKMDASDNYGNTALSKAIEKKDVALVRLLLQEGVSPNLRGSDSKGKLQSAPLWIAYYDNCFSLFYLLLNAGANPDVTDSQGNTLLIDVIKEGWKDLPERLIECGANVNAQNKSGKTALMSAAMKNNEALMKLLIEKAGKEGIELKDSCNRTALFLAIYGNQASNVKLLLDAGADTTVVDSNDKTALAIAKEKGNQEIIGLLEMYSKE